MKTHIRIDQTALNQTFEECHKELHQTNKKYHSSISSLVVRFLIIEFRTYLVYSFSTLLILFSIVPLNYSYTDIILPIYFFILGLLNSYEYYKNQYYQTAEIFTPVYIHPGRQLFIKAASIALLELCLFAFLATILHYLNILSLSKSIMTCFVPLFALQLFTLQLLPYIKNYISSLVTYIFLYTLYSFIYNHFLLDSLSVPITLYIMMSIIVLYIVSFIRLYQHTKKERMFNHGIIT